MSVEAVGVPFILVVHEADIIRRNNKPDTIVLKTNIPNPNFPFSGTLSLCFNVNKKSAEKWLKENIPALKDISVYDDSTHRGVLSVKSKSGTQV
jgi:hypothetical protein